MRRRTIFTAAMFLILNTGCIRKYAINKLGDALTNSGSVYASDDDPDLIRDAAPFSLKLIESLLAESPRHAGLLLAGCRGFTQYAYGFVQDHADKVEDQDVSEAETLRARARSLYVRARDYGLRGLDSRHRGFSKTLRENPGAVSVASKS